MPATGGGCGAGAGVGAGAGARAAFVASCDAGCNTGRGARSIPSPLNNAVGRIGVDVADGANCCLKGDPAGD